MALDADPDCRLFCFCCGRDLGEKSPAIEAVVLCEDCSKDDGRPKPTAMSLVEYRFAIEKELAEKYVWTSKMLARHAGNIGAYAEAHLARGLTVEEAADYMNFMAGYTAFD